MAELNGINPYESVNNEVDCVDDKVMESFYQHYFKVMEDALYLRKVDGSNLSLNQQYRINDYQYSLQSVAKYKSKYYLYRSVFYSKSGGGPAVETVNADLSGVKKSIEALQFVLKYP